MGRSDLLDLIYELAYRAAEAPVDLAYKTHSF